MKNYSKILIEKQQKLSALSSSQMDKYEYPTSERILPLDQSRMI